MAAYNILKRRIKSDNSIFKNDMDPNRDNRRIITSKLNIYDIRDNNRNNKRSW